MLTHKYISQTAAPKWQLLQSSLPAQSTSFSAILHMCEYGTPHDIDLKELSPQLTTIRTRCYRVESHECKAERLSPEAIKRETTQLNRDCFSIATRLPEADPASLLPDSKHALFEKIVRELTKKDLCFSSKIQHIHYEIAEDRVAAFRTPESRADFLATDRFMRIFSKIEHMFRTLEDIQVSSENETRHVRDALKIVTKTKSKGKNNAVSEDDVRLFQAQVGHNRETRNEHARIALLTLTRRRFLDRKTRRPTPAETIPSGKALAGPCPKRPVQSRT